MNDLKDICLSCPEFDGLVCQIKMRNFDRIVKVVNKTSNKLTLEQISEELESDDKLEQCRFKMEQMILGQ